MRHHPPCLATDVTQIFKSCVKTIRTRNRACGVQEPPRPETRRPNPLAVRSRDVLAQLAKMAAFLDDVRAGYCQTKAHIPGGASMSDAERDRIDAGIPRLVAEAKAMLGDLEVAVSQKNLSPQHKEHQLAVVRLIRDYLRAVIACHSEMRAVRMARVDETKKFARLHNRSSGGNKEIHALQTTEYDQQLDELSAEEIQMFEEENAALQMELSGVMSELHTLESTLTGVAKLQQEFTEKVVEQELEIDKVHTSVVATTETIKDANQQLRQAIQRNAGLRVYILFSLLVMSFSLLFLDWYND